MKTYNYAGGTSTLYLSLGAPASIGGVAGPVTVDVSHAAVLTTYFSPYQDNESLTFNVSNSTLDLLDGAWIAGDTGIPVINLSGNSVLNLEAESGSGAQVNISANSAWTGHIDVDALGFHDYGGNVTVKAAGPLAAFSNQVSEIDNAHTTINADVVGIGSFGIGLKASFPHGSTAATLEFLKSVGPGQTVTVGIAGDDPNYVLQLDDPAAFAAHVVLAQGSIDLMGLAKADSYSFKNDILSLWENGKVIDTLHLTNSTLYGFAVEKTTTSINIVALTQSTNPPPGLPVHS